MGYEFRRQDFFAGLILCIVCLVIIVESWRMPRDLQGWPWYAGPGMVIGLLGLGLLSMAIALLVRAYRRAGASFLIPLGEAWAYLNDPQTRRLGLMALLCLGYLLTLGRGMPYSLTTGTYLILTMALFRAASWWVVLLTSGIATAAISLVFNRVFLIPLP